MKVKIGDMEFEDSHKSFSGGSASESSMLNASERSALQKRFDSFLQIAERCYIERHGLKPERSTAEEF